jgi:hypothetical protein
LDPTTNLAIRAILRGLQIAGVISKSQLSEVIEEVRLESRSEAGVFRRAEAADLAKLADDISSDARLDG